MSTHVEGGTVLIIVTAHATLSADPAHLVLSAREGPAPGTRRMARTRTADVQGDEHGRGLAIVADVAGDGNWGIQGNTASRVAWFRLDETTAVYPPD